MAEFDDRLPTYITAHRGKYEAFGGAIAHILLTWDSTKVVGKESDTTPAQIKRGYDATALAEHFGVSLQDAEELAYVYNYRLRQAAEVAFAGLQAQVTMDRVKAYIREHPQAADRKNPIPWRRDNDISNMHFANATYAVVDANPTDQHYVELTRTHMARLERGGSTEIYTVRIENDGLTQKLSIASFNSVINYVHFTVQVTEDELLKRAMRVLGANHFSQLTTILVRSVSEDEINAALNEIWADHQGRSTEEEVGPLLEQLRDRAWAAQQARDISYEHGAELPSMEKLNELGKLFNLRF